MLLRDHLVQHRLLVAVLAQDAAEALDVLRRAAGAAEHDADVRRRHVHAFVEHLTGHDRGVFARVEASRGSPCRSFGLVWFVIAGMRKRRAIS